MRQDWFIAAALGVSMLAVAQQQPKVINAQFHTESAGAGLSATVEHDCSIQMDRSGWAMRWRLFRDLISPCVPTTPTPRGRWMLRCVSTGGFEQHFPIVEQRSGDRDQHCRAGADRSRRRWTRFASLGLGAGWMREGCRSHG